MRTSTEIAAGMHEPQPFTSMTDFEEWATDWCFRCAHEDLAGDAQFCPILAESIAQARAPGEWLLGQVTDSTDTYICIEFSPDDQAWEEDEWAIEPTN